MCFLWSNADSEHVDEKSRQQFVSNLLFKKAGHEETILLFPDPHLSGALCRMTVVKQ